VVQGLTSDTNDIWRYFLQNGQLPAEQGMPIAGDIDISSLPTELKRIVESRKSQFDEGDPDRIDTENEYRALMEEVLGQEKKDNPNAPGMDALKNLSKDELTALLVDWLLNKQTEQNRPQGRNLGPMQPAGHYGAGQTGSGYNGSGSGTSGTGGSSGPVAPSGPATDTSSIKGNTNAEKAFNYFVQKGLTPEQAAGIVGNLQAESGVKPGQHQIGGPAFGIAQWEGGRQDNLRSFAAAQGKDVSDLGVQLDFLWQELQGPENAAFNALKGAGSASEAAAIFENKFERPAANHNAERAALAEEVLRQFGGNGGSMAA
jgi:hypothetical protein